MFNIRYARASLAKTKNELRKHINLDFIIEGSNNINKVTFKLTGRHREYLANLEAQELIDWSKHNDIHTRAVDTRAINPCWIGKGQKRNIYQAGFTPTQERILNTGAILIQKDDHYVFHAGVDQWTFDLVLTESDIDRYPFVGEYHSPNNSMSPKAVKGVWK